MQLCVPIHDEPRAVPSESGLCSGLLCSKSRSCPHSLQRRDGRFTDALEALSAVQHHFPTLPGAPSAATALLLQLGRPSDALSASLDAIARLQGIASIFSSAPTTTASWVAACGLHGVKEAADWLRAEVRASARRSEDEALRAPTCYSAMQAVALALLQAEAHLALGQLDAALAAVTSAQEQFTASLSPGESGEGGARSSLRPLSAATSRSSASTVPPSASAPPSGALWDEGAHGNAKICRLRGILHLARGDPVAALPDLCRVALALDLAVRRDAAQRRSLEPTGAQVSEAAGRPAAEEPASIDSYSRLPLELEAALDQEQRLLLEQEPAQPLSAQRSHRQTPPPQPPPQQSRPIAPRSTVTASTGGPLGGVFRADVVLSDAELSAGGDDDSDLDREADATLGDSKGDAVPRLQPVRERLNLPALAIASARDGPAVALSSVGYTPARRPATAITAAPARVATATPCATVPAGRPGVGPEGSPRLKAGRLLSASHHPTPRSPRGVHSLDTTALPAPFRGIPRRPASGGRVHGGRDSPLQTTARGAPQPSTSAARAHPTYVPTNPYTALEPEPMWLGAEVAVVAAAACAPATATSRPWPEYALPWTPPSLSPRGLAEDIARAQTALGVAYHALGHLARAQTHLENAVMSWPTMLAARFHLGVVLAELASQVPWDPTSGLQQHDAGGAASSHGTVEVALQALEQLDLALALAWPEPGKHREKGGEGRAGAGDCASAEHIASLSLDSSISLLERRGLAVHVAALRSAWSERAAVDLAKGTPKACGDLFGAAASVADRVILSIFSPPGSGQVPAASTEDRVTLANVAVAHARALSLLARAQTWQALSLCDGSAVTADLEKTAASSPSRALRVGMRRSFPSADECNAAAIDDISQVIQDMARPSKRGPVDTTALAAVAPVLDSPALPPASPQVSSCDAAEAGLLGRAFYLRAVSLLSLRDPDGAARDCRAALGLEGLRGPSAKAVHAKLAQSLMLSGDLDGSLAAFDKAVELDSSDAALLRARAGVLAAMGRSGAALADLDASLALQVPAAPDEPKTPQRSNSVDSLRVDEDASAASQVEARAGMDPLRRPAPAEREVAAALETRARLHYARGEFHAAADDFEAALATRALDAAATARV